MAHARASSPRSVLHDIPGMSSDPARKASSEALLHEYRESEGIRLVAKDYMNRQRDITFDFREILIDWLVDVHLLFKLLPETLYLSVTLLDRYLEREQVHRHKLQRAGIVAMLISCKIEEPQQPELGDWVHICDKAYMSHEFVQTELHFVERLGFQITTPNAFFFLQRFSAVAGIVETPRSRTEHVANYLCELTLQQSKMLAYLPSTIAASAVYLALRMAGRTPWPKELERCAGYTEAVLALCVKDMSKLHGEAPKSKLKAVYKKYSQERFGSVAADAVEPAAKYDASQPAAKCVAAATNKKRPRSPSPCPTDSASSGSGSPS